jgi:imidazole glycerol-phosphate synthase subunit HisF
MNHRIIARLDIKGPNLVKGIHLEGLRVLGKPEDFARHYYESGADEFIYADVVASLYERNSLQDIISRTAREIHIPLTVGGGLRSIEDINKALRAGADKVSLNTAAIKNHGIIREASRIFGSSTIVVTIEVIREANGTYLAYTDNGREHTGMEAVSWAKQAEDLGAGEIVLTSVDREGTAQGFDIEIIRKVADAVSIPVIAHGGAGSPAHVKAAIVDGHASAVAIASILHYDYIRTAKRHGKYEEEGNVEFLKSGRAFSKVAPFSVKEIKDYLVAQGVPCRHDIPVEA